MQQLRRKDHMTPMTISAWQNFIS